MEMSVQQNKDAFFAAIRELEQLQTTCTNKGKFLDNVVSGREAITFAVIDRCREAALQLKQSFHVFTQLHTRHANSTLAEPVKFKKMLTDNQASLDKANSDLATILSWVPLAPNTRRSEV